MTTNDWNATEYHRVSNPHKEWGAAVLARVRALDIGRIARACDAGCGTGRVTADLLKLLPERCTLAAVDNSQKMLETARQVLASECSRVEFFRADFQNLPFVSEFDLVFSTAAFHWAPDHDRLFKSLFRAMKPAGTLVAQCGGGANLARIRARELAVLRAPRFAPYFKEWTAAWNYADTETTSARLHTAGFVNCEVWLEESPVVMADVDAYRAFLETVVERTQLAYLPDSETRSRYLDEMMRLGDGDLTFDYWRLNINASKRG